MIPLTEDRKMLGYELLTIYSKKDDNNIPSDNEIISLVNTYCV